MKKLEEKTNKLAIDVLKEIQDLKQKIDSDFIKIDLAILEEKLKKLFNIK